MNTNHGLRILAQLIAKGHQEFTGAEREALKRSRRRPISEDPTLEPVDYEGLGAEYVVTELEGRS